MLVGCPRCKTKLKVPVEKIAPGGTRFKCPRCAVVLLVKPPKVTKTVPLDTKKIIVAHAEGPVVERVKAVLEREGYQVLISHDGVDTLVQCLREMPFFMLVDVALPKIYGFEIIKRLRERPETKPMKFILLSSVYDKRRYRREPASLYGADDYLDEHAIEEQLPEKLGLILGKAPKTEETPAPTVPPPPERTKTPERPPEKPMESPAPPAPMPPEEPAPPQFKPASADPQQIHQPPQEAAATPPPQGDLMVEKAKRLARTIIADINLYSPEKVDMSLKTNNFYTTFAKELKEGKKFYDSRIPPDVREKGDFFKEAIEGFVEKKKKALEA